MKISNKIKTLAAGSAAVVGTALNAGAGLNAGAAFAEQKGIRCPGTDKYETSLDKCDKISEGTGNNNNLMGTINTIINVIIGVIGFVAVVVIILGGVQYTTSAGDPGKVKKAKDTILYGVIGVVVALLAT